MGYTQGLAWCLSAQGDARLEKNFQADCDTADPCADDSAESSHAEHGGDPEHCGDCRDLPIVAPDVHSVSRFSPDELLAGSPAAALPAPRISLSQPLVDQVPGFRPQPPPPPHPTVALLRTVVLII